MTTSPAPLPRPGRWRRLGWLLGLWLASVACLGTLALLIRGLMSLAGMHTP